MVKRCLFLGVVFLAVLSLMGCTPSPGPKETVTSYFEALQKGELDRAATYISGSEWGPIEEDQGQISRAIDSRLSIEVKSESIDGDKAAVEGAVTSLDLVQIMTQIMSEWMPMSLVNQYLLNILSDPNAPTRVTQVTISLKRVDGRWLIIPDEALLNSIIQDIPTYMLNLLPQSNLQPNIRIPLKGMNC